MKNIILLWLIAIPGTLLAQHASNYEIKGQLINVEAGEVYLSRTQGSGIVVDSARVINHTYTLQGYAEPCEAILLTYDHAANKPRDVVSLFLAPEHFRIVHRDAFTAVTISGSKVIPAYNKINQLSKEYNDKIKILQARQANAAADQDQKTADALGKQAEALKEERTEKVFVDVIKKDPASPLAFYAIRRLAGNGNAMDVMKIRPLFDMLPASAKKLAAVQDFQAKLEKQEAFLITANVGREAPDFTQEDTLGNPVKLSSFRGKYLLLDFWASWCGPCRADNPNIVKAYQKYHDKGFEILSVSLDQPGAKNKWLKAIHDDQLTWTHVSDLKYWDNAVVKLYGIQGVPQNFLIDPQGKIVARSLRGEDLDKKLAEIYAGQ